MGKGGREEGGIYTGDESAHDSCVPRLCVAIGDRRGYGCYGDAGGNHEATLTPR